MILDDFVKCKHRWKTVRFVPEKNEWTHYMVCVKCGSRRTVIHQERSREE